MFIWVALNENVKQAKILWTTEICLNPKISDWATEKQPCLGKFDANISSWSYDMEGHVKKCMDRFCEPANKNNSTATPSRNTIHWRPPIQRRRNGICRRIGKGLLAKLFSKWLFLARIGRLDISWSVNKLARAITEGIKVLTNATFMTLVNLNNIVMWKNSITIHIGIVSRLWCCRRARRLKINIRRTLVHIQ